MRRDDPVRTGESWVRVADDLLDRIGRGELPLGGRIPSRGVLAERAAVSLHVVSRALRHLAASGVIRMDRGCRNGYVVVAGGAPDLPPRLLMAGQRRLRVERGMSRRQVAALLGVDTSTVCRIEQGRLPPPPALRIASAFGVPVAEVTALCRRCRYDPDPGYMCLRCGTAAAQEPDAPAGAGPGREVAQLGVVQ